MKKDPTSITVEEAVAYMVNMDYIPEGVTLIEMLVAFLDDAEMQYKKAKKNQQPLEQIALLKSHADICRARLELAEMLIITLQYEVDNPKDIVIDSADKTSINKQLLTFESVAYWAAYNYGIGISARPVDKKLANVRWEDITIKIKENNEIGYKIKKGRFTNKNLLDVGLMGKKRPEPNKKYKILMHLSLGKTFPPGNHAEIKYRKAIFDLGLVLKKLVPLQDGPFYPFNPNEGWKPRFKLTSYLAEDDEYYRKDDFHSSYDDSRYGNNDDDDSYDDNE